MFQIQFKKIEFEIKKANGLKMCSKLVGDGEKFEIKIGNCLKGAQMSKRQRVVDIEFTVCQACLRQRPEGGKATRVRN